MTCSAIDQQNRALEAATVTLRYFTALCPPMGKTREIFDLHFLAKPGFFQANYCDVTKVEAPNCVLTCNMRKEFVAVRVYQAVTIQLHAGINSAHASGGVAFTTHLYSKGLLKISHASSSVYTIITAILSTVQIN